MAWMRLALAVSARVLLCIVGGLLLCSMAPKLLGWQSDVVLTGSMEPTLRTGDVVAYQPVSAFRVQPGHIILVHDPAQPGHLLSHRFVRRTPTGELVTRGDANGHDDSTPVPESAVIGVARMDIPRVGLPLIWWSQGDKARVGLTALGIVLVLVLASSGPQRSRRSDPEPAELVDQPAQPETPDSGPPQRAAETIR